jgi:repressor LexA
MTLTKRQRKILEFIREFVERRGYSPTLAEIGRHFGLRSPATVHKHLRNLEEKGAVKRRWNSSRGIEVLPEEGTTRAYDLPLVGTIEGGKPLVIETPESAVPVPPGLIGERRTYVLRVRGAGFEEQLVRDGDLVVVEEADNLPEGTLGLLLLRGNRPLLGCCEKQGKGMRLSGPAAAPASAPALAVAGIEPPEVRVRGKVIGVLRKY